jgi:hypothetical protein
VPHERDEDPCGQVAERVRREPCAAEELLVGGGKGEGRKYRMRGASRRPEALRCAVSSAARSPANAPGRVYAMPTYAMNSASTNKFLRPLI